MNKKIIELIIFIILFFCSCGYHPFYSELNYTTPYLEWTLRQMSSLQFDFNALYFQKNNAGRVDIYLRVGFDRLTFLKEPNSYDAGYSYRITIIDEETDSVLIDKEYDKNITKIELKEEDRQQFDFSLNSFELPPNSYIVGIKIKDKNSPTTGFKIKKAILRDNNFSKLLLSDILLLKNVSMREDAKQITPVISDNIPYLAQDSIYSFNEIYLKSSPQKVKVTYSLEKIKYNNDVIIETIFDRPFIESYMDYPNKIAARKILFIKDTTIDGYQNTIQLISSYPLIEKQGNFRIKIVVSNSENKDSTSVIFTIHSPGFPKVVSMNDKIRVLSYILKPGEKKSLDTVKDDNEKAALLKSILSGMSPGGMDEYFRRVEYANERFTSNIDGSKTPIGLAYIILGDPDVSFENSWTYSTSKYSIEITVLEVPQRDKYPLYPRICYVRTSSDNAILFWWECVDRWRTR